MSNHYVSFFRKLVDLREGAESKDVIIENVKDDADISSARFWVLVFAIGVASVGLNINSIPVIIGAMLISPLMGPIVSMGLAIAISDWGLLRRSFRNLLILTGISIFISALYFAISPITNAQSELLARTQPTIFDVLIAIFGGMAGFIGISRARYSNVIPGVAIATALIPPLCTVGYGIATMQPVFIFGAFYLFLINSIFICLSSLVVARYLRLPRRRYEDEVQHRRVNRILSIITVIIIAPAAYTAYTFVQQNNFNQNANAYISSVFEQEGYVVIHRNLEHHSLSQKIELAFLSARFDEVQIENFEKRLADFELDDTELSILQNDFFLTENEWESLVAEIRTDDQKIELLEARLESERASFVSPERLLSELQAIYPFVTNISFGPVAKGTSTDEVLETVAIIELSSSTALTREDNDRINTWLGSRLNAERVKLFFDVESIDQLTR